MQKTLSINQYGGIAVVVLRGYQVRPYPLMRRPFILFVNINGNVRVVVRPHPGQISFSTAIVSP